MQRSRARAKPRSNGNPDCESPPTSRAPRRGAVTGFIATAAGAAYLPRMPVTRLMRLTIMLAVLLAPLAMVAGVPARAATHHVAAAQTPHHSVGDHGVDAHCAGMAKKSKEQPRQGRDCMVACAAIIPMCSAIDVRLPSPAVPRTIALATSGHGLEPEAETPPPRLH